MRRKQTKILFFVMILFYNIILDYAYRNIVAEYWDYWFPIQNKTIMDVIVCWITVLLPLFVLDFKKETLSNYVINILFFINYIPSCILMQYISIDLEYMFIFYLYWGFLILLNKGMPYYKATLIIGRIGKKLNFIMVWFFSVSIILIWLVYAKGRISLSLQDIYVARMEARQFDMPLYLNYIYAFARALIPVGIIVCLCQKRKIIGIVFTVVGYIAYLIDGSKQALFSLFIAWGIYITYKYISKNKVWLYITYALNGLGIISICLLKFAGIIEFFSYFFQRMLFLPAIINVHYFNYFKTAEKDFFRQSIVGKLTGMSSPHDIYISRLIGKYAYNNIEMNANTGLVGDAYANLGIIGVVVMPIMIVFLLRIVEACMKNLSGQVYLFLGIILSVTIMSISFFTTLLSNGLIVLSLYMISVERHKQNRTNLEKSSDMVYSVKGSM